MAGAGTGRRLLRVLGDGGEDWGEVGFSIDLEAVAVDFPDGNLQLFGNKHHRAVRMKAMPPLAPWFSSTLEPQTC